MINLGNTKIVLASKSPRRHELLKTLGVDFKIVDLDIDESYDTHLKGKEITDYLAEKKARAYRISQDSELIITADTIVWFDGKALEKPKDRNEAFAMLRSLSGNKHQVYSSVAIRSNEILEVTNDTTDVYFKNLSDLEINYYLDNFQYNDKAGSYGIQDWFGLTCVNRIEGCYYNVMGLPTKKLYNLLSKFSSQIK
jgi:septum formation protein